MKPVADGRESSCSIGRRPAMMGIRAPRSSYDVRYAEGTSITWVPPHRLRASPAPPQPDTREL